MRIALFSLEFSAGTFSGNGIYSQAQIRALTRAGHSVVVVAGAPPTFVGEADACGAQAVIQIPLPTWGRLDGACAWEAYAAGAAGPDTAARLAAFAPEAALSVDWHGWAACEAAFPDPSARPPVVHQFYRVHSAGPGAQDGAVRCWELRALEGARLCTALSQHDAALVVGMRGEESEEREAARVRVLLPALRSDMAGIPPPSPSRDAQAWAGGRPYVTCLARCSEEKEPERFVGLVCEAARQGVLAKHGVTIAIAGAGWACCDVDVGAQGQAFGLTLAARLKEAVPDAVIFDRFLSGPEMAVLLAQTRLNVHPPLADAYGMTIVEAASQGAPSLVHCGEGVGAKALLQSSRDEVIEIDFAGPGGFEPQAECLDIILGQASRLQRVGEKAQTRAREWDEDAAGKQLAAWIQEAASIA